jgi:hypothetical protein
MHHIVLLMHAAVLICDLIKNSINHQTYHPMPFLLYPFAQSQLVSGPPVTFGTGTRVSVAAAGGSEMENRQLQYLS